MKYVAMIQARFGSSRLPGKILMDLCGEPVLQRVIERVQRSRYIDETIVLTSIDPQNLPVLRLCADLGVRVFAGAEDDVLDRYYQMAKLIKPDYVIRITADCPCIDWLLIDQAIELMEPESDYLADFDETLPDGLDLEIIKYSALERSWKCAELSSEREHVTQYIRKNPEIFNIQNYVCPVHGIGHHRWTLDESDDHELIKKIYSYFKAHNKEDFVLKDILLLFDDQPELIRINNEHTRNEGLLKSLMNDKVIKSV